MTEYADIMKNLKTQWGFLKDEKKAKVDRRQACKRIIELSEQAKKLDPKFEVIDMNNTIYAEFVPKDYKKESSVKWGKPLGKDIQTKEANAQVLVSRLECIAVGMTRARLPDEPEDSQKFGMIVSAYTDKLLQAYALQP